MASRAPQRSVDTFPGLPEPFVGREEELRALAEAWQDTSGPRLVQVTGPSGAGKAGLLRKWIEDPGVASPPRKVFAYSFYRDGIPYSMACGWFFLTAALEFFGDPNPQSGASPARAERLAELARKSSALIVIHGVELLQRGPEIKRPGFEGRLDDPGVERLMEVFAEGHVGGALLVVASERAVTLDLPVKTSQPVRLEPVGLDDAPTPEWGFAWVDEGPPKVRKHPSPDLFRGVFHACSAGDHQKAFDLLAGNNPGLELSSDGPFGEAPDYLLALISPFFESRWSQPSKELKSSSRGQLLSVLDRALQRCGRLAEGAGLLDRSAAQAESKAVPTHLAVDRLEARLWAGALERATSLLSALDIRSVSRNLGRRAFSLGGEIRVRRGEYDDAARLFLERPSSLKGALDPETELRVCELWLAQEKRSDALTTAHEFLKISEEMGHSVGVVLAQLVIAREALERKKPATRAAEEALQTALSTARGTTRRDVVARSLLVQAQLRRLQGRLEEAESALEEGQTIALRLQLGLLQADYLAERSRLEIARGRNREAAETLRQARELAHGMGYRQLEMVLEKEFASEPPRPQATPPLQLSDLVTLAYHLARAGHADPDRLQRLDTGWIREAAQRARRAVAQDAPGEPPGNELGALLAALMAALPSVEPPALWRAWVESTKEAALLSLGRELDDIAREWRTDALEGPNARWSDIP